MILVFPRCPTPRRRHATVFSSGDVRSPSLDGRRIWAPGRVVAEVADGDGRGHAERHPADRSQRRPIRDGLPSSLKSDDQSSTRVWRRNTVSVVRQWFSHARGCRHLRLSSDGRWPKEEQAVPLTRASPQHGISVGGSSRWPRLLSRMRTQVTAGQEIAVWKVRRTFRNAITTQKYAHACVQ